jgi:hypothetical protein
MTFTDPKNRLCMVQSKQEVDYKTTTCQRPDFILYGFVCVSVGRSCGRGIVSMCESCATMSAQHPRNKATKTKPSIKCKDKDDIHFSHLVMWFRLDSVDSAI